jgi:organic hydroperoxide reductase OsmC/OhrA
VDPEEAFVASLSSCHMLWFLSIAAKQGFTVESYWDNAEALMEKNVDGKLAITVVTLRPKAVFAKAKQPSVREVRAMHHRAHEECFIASSVNSDVRCLPVV